MATDIDWCQTFQAQTTSASTRSSSTSTPLDASGSNRSKGHGPQAHVVASAATGEEAPSPRNIGGPVANVTEPGSMPFEVQDIGQDPPHQAVSQVVHLGHVQTPGNKIEPTASTNAAEAADAAAE